MMNHVYCAIQSWISAWIANLYSFIGIVALKCNGIDLNRNIVWLDNVMRADDVAVCGIALECW